MFSGNEWVTLAVLMIVVALPVPEIGVTVTGTRRAAAAGCPDTGPRSGASG